MRSIYKIVVCSLLTLSITSCEKDLLEKEQTTILYIDLIICSILYD